MRKAIAYILVLVMAAASLTGCGKMKSTEPSAKNLASAMQEEHETESFNMVIQYDMTLTEGEDVFPLTFLMDTNVQADKRDSKQMASRVLGTVDMNMLGDEYDYALETYSYLTDEALKLYSGMDGDWSYEQLQPEKRSEVILELKDVFGDSAEDAKSWTMGSATTQIDGTECYVFAGEVKIASIPQLFRTLTSDLGIDEEEYADMTATGKAYVAKETLEPVSYEYDLTETLAAIFQAYAVEDDGTTITVAKAGCSVSQIVFGGEPDIVISDDALAAETAEDAYIDDGEADTDDAETDDSEIIDDPDDSGEDDIIDWGEDDEEDPEADAEYESKLAEIETAGAFTLSAEYVDTVFEITWPAGMSVSYFDEETAQFCVADDMNYLYFTIYEKELYDLSEGIPYLMNYYIETFEADSDTYSNISPSDVTTLPVSYATEYVDISADYMGESGYHYLIALQEYEDCWLVVEADILTVEDPAAFMVEAINGMTVRQ